jgi:hypothetical protein
MVLGLMSKAGGRGGWSELMGRVAERMNASKVVIRKYAYRFSVEGDVFCVWVVQSSNPLPTQSWRVMEGSQPGMVMLTWDRDPTSERCDVRLDESTFEQIVMRELTFMFELNSVGDWVSALQRVLAPECEVRSTNVSNYIANVGPKGSAETIKVMPCWTRGGYKTSVDVVDSACTLYFQDAQHLKDHLMQCGRIQSSFDDLALRHDVGS